MNPFKTISSLEIKSNKISDLKQLSFYNRNKVVKKTIHKLGQYPKIVYILTIVSMVDFTNKFENEIKEVENLKLKYNTDYKDWD